MDVLTKWRTGQILDINEVQIVLKELFDGAKKKFIFDSLKPINTILYQIYQDFQDSPNSNYILGFSDLPIKITFLSLTLFENLKYHQIIKLKNNNIYIYNSYEYTI